MRFGAAPIMISITKLIRFLSLGLVLFNCSIAAEIYARKMEILRVPSGQATQFRDSVVIQDGGTTITCQRALVSESQSKAFLAGSVIIQTPEVRVESDSVEYDLGRRRAYILAYPEKRVLVRQESLVISAPEIEYLLSDAQVQAPRGLELKNISGLFNLTGSKGTYNLSERSGVIDSIPVLVFKSDREEPVVITAKRMEWLGLKSLVKASGSVSVASGEGQITADSALFYTERDSGVAWGNPLVQDGSGMAKSDTLVFLVHNRTLSRIIFIGDAEGRYCTGGGDTVMVKGNELTLSLADGKITQIGVANLYSGQLIRSAPKSDGLRQ
ncbi:MAG: hypothetical protein ABIK49_01000 [candidate division WOR-3 bacterium]